MSGKILVVDDEPNLLRIISYALEAEGYEIVTAETGPEALEKIKSSQPDLVILDVKLPGMSGFEVCQQIRSDPTLGSLPVLMLSARIQVTDKITGLKAGADEYVTKPVDTDELVARVASLLERTRRLQQTTATQRGKLLTFIGAKGGVGATTVALNFATVFLNQMKRVIIVELTPSYGTLARQLQHHPTTDLSHLLNLEVDKIDESMVAPHLLPLPFKLRMLCGPQQPADFPAIHPDQADAIIHTLTAMADCVIVDLPDFPSAASQRVISQSDFTFLVVEPEPVAVDLGRMKLAHIANWGCSQEQTGAIVNRRTSDMSMTLHEVEQKLTCRMMGVIPPATEAMEMAQKQGAPLVLCRPDHLASTIIHDMVNRIAGIRFWL
ncbi:MAG: response regulator [Caldilineaceae bacterium]|nr:response regulator [Caldilineaceae bacterium]